MAPSMAPSMAAFDCCIQLKRNGWVGVGGGRRGEILSDSKQELC